ncbi:MAG TPA: hypothetical protein PLL17_01795 [Defluviitaleaceae bacterium]|nr:hypothetical protein [Candidatus Epulonipiscium sp.]HOQ16848.1 hypothetical protein [Defluviitaleaceae bacterium]HQD49851.1 hypothetical protein [Defluviitaleaceae bacterium]
MNHLNQNSYELQDIPEPFRGQHKDFSINPNPGQIDSQPVTSSGFYPSFKIEDLLLILLLFLLLNDNK